MSTSYSDLINVPSFGKKRESTFNMERGEIVFYCRACQKIVDAVRLPPQKIRRKMREYLYECPDCKSQHIAIGTTESIKEHYRKH